MTKKILISMLTLFAMATTADETDYGFSVGTVPVTSDNASNVTGGGIKKGKVTYDAKTRTLTLKDVEIETTGSGKQGIRNEEMVGLKIRLEGTNTITTGNSCALRVDGIMTYLFITKGSKTTFTADAQEAVYLTGGAPLYIQGAESDSGELTLKSNTDCAVEGKGEESISFQYGAIVTLEGPKGSLVNLKKAIFEESSKYKTRVTLKATKNTSYNQVQNVAAWEVEGYNHIDAPVYKANHPKFSTSSKTILKPSGLSGNLTSYDIVINEDVLQLNSTHIPDANFLAYVKTLYTQNENGYPNRGFYSKAMAKEVAKINVNDKNISKLDGIEYFTGITDLDCANNQLTSLNVSGCNALTDLQCYNNQLSSLNVSGCTALIQLSCGHNQLTSLSVSGCTALTKLYCYNNQLKSLDVSNNTALITLWCYGNKINKTNMQTLVNSLPTVSGGKFYVINTKDSNEENVITKPQVNIANGKGWTVYDNNGGSSIQYAGSDTSPVEAIEADAESQNNIWYTIDGKKLNGEPTRKGVYIVNGKKIVK